MSPGTERSEASESYRPCVGCGVLRAEHDLITYTFASVGTLSVCWDSSDQCGVTAYNKAMGAQRRKRVEARSKRRSVGRNILPFEMFGPDSNAAQLAKLRDRERRLAKLGQGARQMVRRMGSILPVLIILPIVGCEQDPQPTQVFGRPVAACNQGLMEVGSEEWRACAAQQRAMRRRGPPLPRTAAPSHPDRPVIEPEWT